MPIEKLEEFARDGQKNTDELILTDGFPRPKFPARQWFNYLFNMLSLKINEIIDLDPVSRSEIVDDLTTNDSSKALSASMGKKLQDDKFAIADLVNDLTSGGRNKALTAEQGKLLFEMFNNNLDNNGFIKIPNPTNPEYPVIFQWIVGGSDSVGRLIATNPIAFPNRPLGGIANEGYPSGWQSGIVTVWAFDLQGSSNTHSWARVRQVTPSNIAYGNSVTGRILVWGY